MEGHFSLQTKDKKIFKLSKKAAVLSELLKGMKDIPDEYVIPLNDDINSQTIEKIINYLIHYDGNSPKEISKPLYLTDMKKITDEYSADFVDKLNIDELVDMISAAHYMKINSLLNLCCAKMVSLCKGKNEEEIFKIFGVPKDYFKPEDKEKIKEKNKWIDEVFQ